MRRSSAPRGDVSEFGAARFFRRTGEGVYDMDDLAVRTTKMAAFVRAHRDAAKPSAVIGLGYSNGANILASVLFADPALFDAAVLMHPLIPFEPEIEGDLAGKRMLITAGRRDPICPPDLTSRLEAHLRAAERRCHSGLARRRARGEAERDRGGQAFPGAVRAYKCESRSDRMSDDAAEHRTGG